MTEKRFDLLNRISERKFVYIFQLIVQSYIYPQDELIS